MDEAEPSQATRDWSNPGGAPLPDTAAELLTIARYRVLKALGQGGFGSVYLAQDGDLERLVAIKVPRPDGYLRSGDVEAYLAEARILARMDHPHILPVYDVGRTGRGSCFIVTKYIEGEDLSTHCRRIRASFRDAAGIVAAVAEGLHHAHTRGLVHRDVKPANILIDAAGHPWLTDFGLALKDEDFGTGMGLAGTFVYMSPEQARGEGHRVDGRSDIFSLGVVLYELLTGRLPFQGKDRGDLLEQIITREARPPRQIDDRDPSRTRANLPHSPGQASRRPLFDGLRHGRRSARLPPGATAA